MEYKFLTTIPEALLEIDVTQVHEVLGGPTLIHLKGKKKEALFLSILLHGNETTSFTVLQKVLKNYQNSELPRDIIIFIGNTLAAAQGMRHLPDQADYNRIWDLKEKVETPEHKLAMSVIDYAKSHDIFASIDIHNNTGKNPNYACINYVKDSFVALASHFGSHTVYFTEPHNVQSNAFASFCTAVTIEAGKPGEQTGIDAAYGYVLKILNMDTLYENESRKNKDIYHTIARMKVHKDSQIDFEDTPSDKSDFSFVSNLDSNNFEFIPKGARMGHAKDLSQIIIENNKGENITTDFLEVTNGELRTKRVFIPSMFTKDIYVMKEDCLGYIMELMLHMR